MGKKKNSIAVRKSQAVTGTSSARLRDMWQMFRDKKSRNGTFVAFDDYRQSLGGRGIWGTKIFFRSMVEIGFLVTCDDDMSKGKYCPSEVAMDKYGDLFKYDDEAELWGLSEQHLDTFDLQIFPHLIKVARQLEHIFDEEKKEKQKARYAMKKAEEKAHTKLFEGGLI